jgi:hypothetical protein
MIPDDFKTPPDSAIHTIGITRAIRSILYHSNSSTEALQRIDDMWKTYHDPCTVSWRQMFYRLLEIDTPSDLPLCIDGYSGFIL